MKLTYYPDGPEPKLYISHLPWGNKSGLCIKPNWDREGEGRPQWLLDGYQRDEHVRFAVVAETELRKMIKDELRGFLCMDPGDNVEQVPFKTVNRRSNLTLDLDCTLWNGQLRDRGSDYSGRAFKEKADAKTQNPQH